VAGFADGGVLGMRRLAVVFRRPPLPPDKNMRSEEAAMFGPNLKQWLLAATLVVAAAAFTPRRANACYVGSTLALK
jgi:hypothetical protein